MYTTPARKHIGEVDVQGSIMSVPAGWGSQTSWQSAHEGGIILSAPRTGRLYSAGNITGSHESTPEPLCGRKNYVNEKFQWHHRKSNPLVAQWLNQMRHRVRRSRRVSPLILNLDIRGRCECFNFKNLPLYFQERAPGIIWIGDPLGARNSLDALKKKKTLSLARNWNLDCPSLA
jgi:hypothetical protein